MRRIVINENDVDLFNSPFHANVCGTYMEYSKEMRRMVKQQGEGFWIQFVTSFRSFAVNNKGTKNMDILVAEEAFIDMLKMLTQNDKLCGLFGLVRSLKALNIALIQCDVNIFMNSILRVRFNKPFETMKLYFRFITSFAVIFQRWQIVNRSKKNSFPNWTPPSHWRDPNVGKDFVTRKFELYLKSQWGKALPRLLHLGRADIMWLDQKGSTSFKRKRVRHPKFHKPSKSSDCNKTEKTVPTSVPEDIEKSMHHKTTTTNTKQKDANVKSKASSVNNCPSSKTNQDLSAKETGQKKMDINLSKDSQSQSTRNLCCDDKDITADAEATKDRRNVEVGNSENMKTSFSKPSFISKKEEYCVTEKSVKTDVNNIHEAEKNEKVKCKVNVNEHIMSLNDTVKKSADSVANQGKCEKQNPDHCEVTEKISKREDLAFNKLHNCNKMKYSGIQNGFQKPRSASLESDKNKNVKKVDVAIKPEYLPKSCLSKNKTKEGKNEKHSQSTKAEEKLQTCFNEVSNGTKHEEINSDKENGNAGNGNTFLPKIDINDGKNKVQSMKKEYPEVSVKGTEKLSSASKDKKGTSSGIEYQQSSNTSYGRPLDPPRQTHKTWLYRKCDRCNILEKSIGVYKRCGLCVSRHVLKPKVYCSKYCQAIDWKKQHRNDHCDDHENMGHFAKFY